MRIHISKKWVKMWKKLCFIAALLVLFESLIVWRGVKRNYLSAGVSSVVRSLPLVLTPHGSKCRKLGFAQPPLPITTLASYPGSGNTWIRHLLQTASGVYTGSVYNDYDLKIHGFKGEYVKDGTVIAIKTHEGPSRKSPFSVQNFARAILLMRDPVDAGRAEFNRRRTGGSHVRVTDARSIQTFLPKFLSEQLDQWERIHAAWLKVDEPVLLVEYEKLKADPRGEMEKVFRFLNFTVSSEDLNCMMALHEGQYHRKPAANLTLQLDPAYVSDAREAVSRVRTLYQQRKNQTRLSRPNKPS